MIRWFANNGIAANFLMLAILIAGGYTAMYRVPLEVSPNLSWQTVGIEMPYRGGTAKDVERAILIPIEQALEGVEGVEHINADGMRGMGRFWINAKPETDVRALMDDINARIDTITTFPDETERPRVYIPESGNFFEVLSVAVTGKMGAHELREVARRVQEDIIALPGVSRANMAGDLRTEISIEAKADKLISYNLSFQDLADAIRRFSVDLPAGSIDSDSGTFVIRTRGQAYSERDFEKIPIRAADGAELLLGDIANVIDGFEDDEKVVEFNGKPALFVEVLRTGKESAIEISDQVREYVNSSRTRFPEGIELFVWDDESISIRGRLSTLVSSLLQGGLLVLIVLGLFLRPSLAFWIVIGIPVGFAGGVLLMPFFGITANVMSLFGYIIVVGIVVDDAIVTGENVYTKIKEGMPPLEAAVQGTEEVATPVTFGALTTMVAFIPLLFFEGTWGDFARQIPPVVAPVLLFSLIESKFVLPSHLKHLRRNPGNGWISRFQGAVSNGLETFIERVYQPTLHVAVQYRATVLALFAAMAFAMFGYCNGGRMGFVSFPTVDRQRISAILDLPDNTPIEITQKYVDRLSEALETIKPEFVDPGTGEPLIQNVTRVIGGYGFGRRSFDKSVGYVSVEVLSPDLRSEPGPKNSEIAKRWTDVVGEIPEAKRLRIYSDSSLKKGRDGDDEHLNIELRGPASEAKNTVAREIKAILESYDGIATAWARINEGQDELELSLKPRAVELGLNQQMLAQQVRQAFFGEEAQRVQRGIDDIRVMVRLPKEDRESLHTLDRMKIRTPSGANVPLATVADIAFSKAPSYVERNDGAEIIRIGCQPVDETVDILGISKELAPRLDEMCARENLSYKFEGYVAEAEDAKKQTILGAIILFITLYGMLSIPLKSITQPFFVMLSVPFAIIGALLGHIYMDLVPSYLSIFGMLALAGIAVNDTLVMVDYVNRRMGEGKSLKQAALEAGSRRFRPIMLTSVTTFAGLLPLMMDRSLQAQFLIPMAVSLAFGVIFATSVTLFLVPCSLLMADDLKKAAAGFRGWYLRPFRKATSTTGH
jgi:multidrug efflux pump subunit AcrB